MAVLQPRVTQDPAQDSWQFETTNQINFTEERLLRLLGNMRDLPDGSTVDDLRDAIIAALQTKQG